MVHLNIMRDADAEINIIDFLIGREFVPIADITGS